MVVIPVDLPLAKGRLLTCLLLLLLVIFVACDAAVVGMVFGGWLGKLDSLSCHSIILSLRCKVSLLALIPLEAVD